MDLQKNAQRFTGFAALYDEVRPTLPAYAIACIRQYLGRDPEQVVDLGCGTGLSTLALTALGGWVTGVEPSADMLRIASSKKAPDTVSFREGYAHATGLPDHFADVVVCSQSFHWMEPVSTLREVGRILRLPQGPGEPAAAVFAVIDCDWPPLCGWQAEQAWEEFTREAKRLADETEALAERSAHAWDKSRHLEYIKSCGLFRYAREVVFASQEQGSAERMIALAESQGTVQDLRKYAPGRLDAVWDDFCRRIRTACGPDFFEMDFSYRLRIGVR